jgi:hypothetical protein
LAVNPKKMNNPAIFFIFYFFPPRHYTGTGKIIVI